MPGKHARVNIFASGLRLVITLFVIFLLVWPFAEPYTLQVEQTQINSSSLPASVGQLRIAYISDFHLSGFPFYGKGQLRDLIRKVNSLNADIVLLGGDYATSTETAIDFFLELPNIRSNYGVYAVLGENDRSNMDADASSRLRAAIVSAGITPLINASATVRIGKNDIYLVGLDDVVNGNPRLNTVASSVSQEDYVIFLCHNPSIIHNALTATDKQNRINWFDLGLFGHTHGGQIPFFSKLLGIVENEQYGWISENRIPMLISPGIGTSGLPIRFFRRPTVHVINIRSEK